MECLKIFFFLNCLRRSFFVQTRVSILICENLENQFGRHKKNCRKLGEKPRSNPVKTVKEIDKKVKNFTNLKTRDQNKLNQFL